MKLCYLSGPITGTNDYEQRFDKAAKEVVAMGFTPVNPVTLLHEHDKTWEAYMKESIKAMMDCEVVYFMEGAMDSQGAFIEFQLAQRLGFQKIFELN